MAEVHVTGDFNISACDDCPVQDECKGYAFVDSIRNTFRQRYANPAEKRFIEAVEQATLYPNDVGRRRATDAFDIARRRFNGVLARSKQVEKIITAIISQSVEAQIIPEAETKLANLDVALTKVLRETNIGPDVPLTVQDLDAAGTHVRYYASTGICGAINIEESA